jgi:hypothetical protein
MGVVLCKGSWSNDWGKSMCCIPVYCLVKWSNGVKEIWSCDLYGLEDFEKRGNGLKRVKSEQFDPLKTSSLSMMKKAVSLLVSGQNLGGYWLGLVWSLESVFVVQYMHCFAFCLFVTSFFSDKPFNIYGPKHKIRNHLHHLLVFLWILFDLVYDNVLKNISYYILIQYHA